MLSLVERSVVVVTPDNIESVVLDCDWLSSAWKIANVYLASAGAELLGNDAPSVVGFSEELTCFVSAAYFENGHPFSDSVVTRQPTSPTTASTERPGCGRRERVSGSSTSTSGSARSSPTRVRRIRGSWSGVGHRLSGGYSPGSSMRSASATAESTRAKSRTSSGQPGNVATGGRSSLPVVHRRGGSAEDPGLGGGRSVARSAVARLTCCRAVDDRDGRGMAGLCVCTEIYTGLHREARPQARRNRC